MAALVVLVLIVGLALAGGRWGVDSSHTADPADRYWRPSG